MFQRVISTNGRSLTLIEVAVLCCCCLCYSAYADTINGKGCGRFDQNLKVKPGKILKRPLQPWIVHIYAVFDPWQQKEKGTFGCSGSIISPRFVLTSAHCLTNGTASCGYRIRACTPSLVQVYYNFTVAQRGPYLAAKSIFYHPDLDAERWMNDIALIMLEEPLRFDEYVRPVCLPKKRAVRDGVQVASPEWGTKKDEQVHRFLYHSTAKIVPFRECNKNIKLPNVYGMKWDRLLFCTRSNGENPLLGLAGGPLTVMSEGKRAVQVGVASYTFCKKDYKPSVHTRLGPYIPWIKKVLNRCAMWQRRGNTNEKPR